MSATLDYAIQLNNEGVSLLNAGDDQEAVSTFTRSLALVREQIFDKLPGDEASQDCYACKPATSAVPSQIPLVNLQDSTYYIYNRTMTISPTHPRTSENLPIYSSCIVLNLALTYHRLGQQGYKSCITKAERMYNMVTKLLAGLSMVGNETAMSIRMVAINNLAQIHHEQNRFLETQEEIEYLSSLIQQGVSCSSFFNESDLHFLILNVMLWSPPTVASAA